MKWLWISSLIAAMLLAGPFAVQGQQTQTLVTSDISHGGYGALIYGVTALNGQPAYLRGTRAAWILNLADAHTLHLGLGSYRTGTDVEPAYWNDPSRPEPEMKTNYGGFEIEYTNRSHCLVHYSVQTLIGSGNVRYSSSTDEFQKESDTYFVLQPGVHLNLNITTWFRLSGGVLYRYTSGVSLDGTSSSDLSGFSALVGLRFGWF